jgi:hypothetical protein
MGWRVVRRVTIVIVTVLVLAAVGFLFWTHLTLRGERAAALDAWRDPAIAITSTDAAIVMEPTGANSGTGLVFVPGARVDPYAYLYKLSGIVESGVTVVITKPVLGLALFDTRPLKTFTAAAPGVDHWFVGGHSLGGVRACLMAQGSDASGLVLFGSYCANDLSRSGLSVLSIAGSEDGLSTESKIAGAKSLLPADTQFVRIDGLNHAGFGDYGLQPGDGESRLTDADERAAITAALRELL